MRSRKIMVAMAAVALLAGACGQLGTTKLDVQTFNLDHRAGYEAAELIAPYVFGDRAQNPGTMSATSEAITVRETRDNLEKIARVLAEFDQPIPGVRLYFQLIEADSFEDEDPAISSVVQELRSLFRFEGYRLLGEAMVPVAGGTQERHSISQRFLGVDSRILVEASAVVLRNGVVRLDPVLLKDLSGDLMTTAVNVSPGQTIVIGGTQARTRSPEGNPFADRVVILTVRAETE